MERPGETKNRERWGGSKGREVSQGKPVRKKGRPGKMASRGEGGLTPGLKERDSVRSTDPGMGETMNHKDPQGQKECLARKRVTGECWWKELVAGKQGRGSFKGKKGGAANAF